MQEEEANQTEETIAGVEELAANETALVPYLPKSKAPFKLDTLIPRNMAFEVQKALNRVVQFFGNMDNYVRDHLKYDTVEAMWKGLAAEQVDSLALYLSQFEREQGLIIGDQTGIGKGRQAAGVIRHAVLNGYLPVFFTRKPDLFTDIYRDLKNIGFGDIHPFIVNTDTNARIKDAKGHVVFSPLSKDEQRDELVIDREVATDSEEAKSWFKLINKKLPDSEEVPFITISESIDYMPDGYDMIFCTYSQIQAAHPYKRNWIAKLIRNGIEGSKKNKKVIFILDESHMAGGFDSIIGTWMRKVIPDVKCCCFLSATFAKYPEVMPLYAPKTSISESTLSPLSFVGAMRKGGLALQEIVASNLAESGQLIRRQRSNEGIEVFYHEISQEPLRSKNRESVDRIVRIMNMIVQFEQDYVNGALSAVHAQAFSEGAHLKDKPKSLGVKQSPYFSRVFNIVDQMLFALKVEEVANMTLDLLSQNKKVVIAFKSTMGAFLKDLNLSSGDQITSDQMDFVRTLQKGLDSILTYSYTSIDNVKSRRMIDLETLSIEAQERYEEIKKTIWDEATGLSISPIDELIRIIEGVEKPQSIAGHNGPNYKVAEVTGRNQKVMLDDDDAIVQSFRTDTEKYFRLFNSGEYDVLLINQSGSTGSSAHASEDFEDQRQRSMIIHQFELDINTEIQKRGRINRTGQVVKPEYHYVTTDIPAEVRLLTMLKGKLKSLDANTTGSQKTSDDALRSADFMNKYGDYVAFQWVEENRHMMEQLGWPTYHMEKQDGVMVRVRNKGKEGAIRQVTGRAGLLTVDEQERLYNDLLQRYETHINWEKQQGTYDLETEFLKLDADVKKKFTFQEGKGGSTPFGKDTVREESIINNHYRPLTKDEIDKMILDVLNGNTPEKHQKNQIKEVEDFYAKLIEERKERREQAIQELEKELAERPASSSAESDKENEKIERQRKSLKDLIEKKKAQLKDYLEELKNTTQMITGFLKFWKVGDVIQERVRGTSEMAKGIFLGAESGYGDNPYTPSQISFKFAMADVRRIIKYNLAIDQRQQIDSIYAAGNDLKENAQKEVHQKWNEMVKNASQKREKRHILTENIVGVADEITRMDRLIKYNTLDGKIKNGILLYGEQDEIIGAITSISKMNRHIRDLEVDEIFTDKDLLIRFKKIDTTHYQVFIPKKGGRDLYLDQKLRSLIMKGQGQKPEEPAEFVQNANEMTAPLSLHKLDPFLLRLDELGIKAWTEARELEDWEIENAEDWINKTTPDQEYSYRLSRPYGQGDNPTTDFVRYEEPTAQYPNGILVYGRPLMDREKFNYSLIPVFKEADEPFQSWKTYINQSPALKKELVAKVAEVKSLGIPDGIIQLGYFIFNNPHEDGNSEFVFGDFDEIDLGRVAYEDTIGKLSRLDIIMAQLTLELQAA